MRSMFAVQQYFVASMVVFSMSSAALAADSDGKDGCSFVPVMHRVSILVEDVDDAASILSCASVRTEQPPPLGGGW